MYMNLSHLGFKNCKAIMRKVQKKMTEQEKSGSTDSQGIPHSTSTQMEKLLHCKSDAAGTWFLVSGWLENAEQFQQKRLNLTGWFQDEKVIAQINTEGKE